MLFLAILLLGLIHKIPGTYSVKAVNRMLSPVIVPPRSKVVSNVLML